MIVQHDSVASCARTVKSKCIMKIIALHLYMCTHADHDMRTHTLIAFYPAQEAVCSLFEQKIVACSAGRFIDTLYIKTGKSIALLQVDGTHLRMQCGIVGDA
ncbi:hypothetical protein D3C86_1474830 [compost metagenome]